MIFNEMCMKVQQCVFTVNHLWIVINGLLFDTNNICSSANLHSFFSFILALVHLPSNLFRPYSFPPTLSNCSHLSFSLVFPWYCDRKVRDLGCSVLIKPVGMIPRACAENRGATANKQSTHTLKLLMGLTHTQPQARVSATRYTFKIAYSRHCLYSKQIEVIKACMLRRAMKKVCHG